MPDWPELVEQHGPLVWSAVYRLVGNEADAADCFQDTFLRALKYVQRKPVANWPGLLRRIAVQAALDRLRERIRVRRRVDPAVDCGLIPASVASPADELERAELLNRLRLALSQLSAGQAEIFVLCQLHGLSYQEIADLLGVETSAIGVSLHRARARLREIMDDHRPSERKCVDARGEQ